MDARDKAGLQPGETLGKVEREPKSGSLGASFSEQRRRDLLDRPMVQARIGPPEDGLDLGAGVTAPSRLRVRGQGWAAVTLASADGQPLATGKKALLTVATRVQNSGMLWSADQRYLRDWGTGPGRVDPFVGTIDIKADSRPKVRRMGVDGTPGEELVVKSAGDGWWRLTLDATVSCPWFLVER